MNNTGFYDSFFAVIMFLSFTLPVFVYFLNCLINYSWMIKHNPAPREEETVKEQHKPIVLNFNLAKPKEGNYRGRRVQLNKPRVNKKNPSKSHVYVNTPKCKTVKVNFTTPKHVSKPKKPAVKTPENDNIIKETVKTLKTLGYKSGEVKKTLQNLCISNQFKNSESLIEAFFKLG